MIHLYFKEPRTKVGTFQTFEEVCDYLHFNHIYDLKKLYSYDSFEVDTDLAETRWRFVYHKHADVNILWSATKELPLRGIEKQAFDQGLDFIEIYQGQPIPEQIPVTSEINVSELIKSWCFEFCRCHGLCLVENLQLMDEEGKDHDPTH